MRKTQLLSASTSVAVIITLAALAAGPGFVVPAVASLVGFDSDTWSSPGPQIVEHAGRTCMTGFSYLEGVDLPSGVMEVDLYATGVTSYPGFVFHVADRRNYEHLYVRPHRAGRYPDAVQYAPCVNGISSWQLCNGDGFTSPVELPDNEWVHLRLEFSGDQARLFVGDAQEPALHVKELKRGVSGGSVGLQCPSDGSAYFSNFSYRADDSLAFDPVPAEATPPGTITDWELSQGFSMDRIDLELPPSAQDVEIEWTPVASEPSGLVNVGRYVGRTGSLPDCVFARTTLHSDAQEADGQGSGGREPLRLEFGYSDAVSVFLNGELLFTASNAYRERDATSLGIIGYFDALYLPLQPGENELALIVTESFGGWGLMARDGNAVYEAPSVKKGFEVQGFFTPESIVCDPARGVAYVSNYDIYRRTAMLGGQFLSRISPDGRLLDEQWVGKLAMPTGMLLHDDRLFVVERRALAVIDVESGEVIERHEIPNAAFPNDVAMDSSGRIYVSDTAGNAIHRLVDGESEVWMQGDQISAPNALLVSDFGADKERLLVGNGSDSCLKSVDLGTGEVATVARFREGNIDGIVDDGEGAVLVSHWEGRLYRVHADGRTERLIDTSAGGGKIADFGYDAERGLIFVPTFFGDEVTSYSIR
ncbi:MAG: SMP-30/gluconolactonase/LRE family protein [Candidatus Eisenbacteria bacterium]|nr:SMP-30/gluconolactonase/LRE family protein [Candidatus Eisenbacteria bacterium]